MLSRSLCLALCALLGACASSRNAPPPRQAQAEQRSLLIMPPASPAPITRSSPVPFTSMPTPMPTPTATPATALSTGPVSPSNPSAAIVAVNRSVAQPLGPNSPPPSSFENSCAPAPYLFQSIAGYEAVRVKDCSTDQLLYLPTSARTQIETYVAECRQRCGQ